MIVSTSQTQMKRYLLHVKTFFYDFINVTNTDEKVSIACKNIFYGCINVTNTDEKVSIACKNIFLGFVL